MELNDINQPLRAGLYVAPDGRYWFVRSVRSSGHVKLREVDSRAHGEGDMYIALQSDVERVLREGGDVPKWSRQKQMKVTLETLDRLPSWLSISGLCEVAGIPSSTIRALLKRRRDGQDAELSLRQSKDLEMAIRDMSRVLDDMVR